MESRSRPSSEPAESAPHRPWVAIAFLLWLVIRRDAVVSYRRTLLGAGWAIVRPVVTLGVFVLVFERLMRVSSGSTPYVLFALTALIPWQLFADSVSRSAASLLNNRGIIAKSQVQRLVFPIAAIANTTLNAIPAFMLLGVLLLAYSAEITPAFGAFPGLVLLQLLMTLGLGLGLAALVVFIRDISPALPLVLQVLLLATPIAYPVDLVPAELRSFYLLNPLASLVEAYRGCLLYGRAPTVETWLALAGIAVLCLVGGGLVFARLDRRLPDVI